MARKTHPAVHHKNESLPSRTLSFSRLHHGPNDAKTPPDEASFPFINVGQSLKIDHAGRSIIRTQVMQDFYRKSKSLDSYGHDSFPQNPFVKPGSQMKRFRLMPTKLLETGK